MCIHSTVKCIISDKQVILQYSKRWQRTCLHLAVHKIQCVYTHTYSMYTCKWCMHISIFMCFMRPEYDSHVCGVLSTCTAV
jgi:hypothetical protein